MPSNNTITLTSSPCILYKRALGAVSFSEDFGGNRPVKIYYASVRVKENGFGVASDLYLSVSLPPAAAVVLVRTGAANLDANVVGRYRESSWSGCVTLPKGAVISCALMDADAEILIVFDYLA